MSQARSDASDASEFIIREKDEDIQSKLKDIKKPGISGNICNPPDVNPNMVFGSPPNMVFGSPPNMVFGSPPTTQNQSITPISSPIRKKPKTSPILSQISRSASTSN